MIIATSVISGATLVQGLKIYASLRLGWKVSQIAYKSVKTVQLKKTNKDDGNKEVLK